MKKVVDAFRRVIAIWLVNRALTFTPPQDTATLYRYVDLFSAMVADSKKGLAE